MPFADTSTYALPEQVPDEAALMLADILPTAYEVGVRAGRVAPGDTVVIVGAGPIGLAAIVTAHLYSPGRIVVVDPAAARRDAAKALGADLVLDPGDDVESIVRENTDGLGADVTIEAVGIPGSFELCTRLVRPVGRVANVGVHGTAVTLHLEQLWDKDITITTGLVGHFVSRALIPGNLLQEGLHFVWVALITLEPMIVQFYEPDVVAFQVIESTEGESARGDYAGDISGAVRPLLKWTTVFNPAEQPGRN